MILTNKKMIIPSIIVSACSLTTLAHADINKINQGWYVGGSIGQSNMDPGTEGTNWNTTDKNDMSKKAYVGKELNEYVGIEAFWTDLGTASLKSTSGAEGKVGYKGVGANVIVKSPHRFRNFEPFAKLGVTRLKTQDREDVTREQKNKTSVLAGVGVDYKISNDWAVRSEFDYYDKDISDLNVGLKWSPGHRPHTHNRVEKPKPVVIPKPRPKPIVRAKPKPAPKPKVVYVPKKVYVELVNDIKNQRIAVKSIDISGHTDSVGTHQSNQILSINRANSVASYLASRGISSRMMRTFGMGETQPIASNKTEYGKAQNRRVEIMINGTSREIVRR